jgi:hypothetical protein
VGFDDRIRNLCNRLLNSSNDEEAVVLVSELKTALHDHIERVRTQLKALLQPLDDDEIRTAAGS